MKHCKGAALLTAMLLVALVATLTSAMLWQQWRLYETEKISRSAIQAHWLQQGVVDWARLILREDAKGSSADHLSEPWALELKEAPLRQMLSNYLPDAAALDAIPDAKLAGHIEDMQGRLNLHNLLRNNQIDMVNTKALQRIWSTLGLPMEEWGQLQLHIHTIAESMSGGKKGGIAEIALLPRQLQDLQNWGLSTTTIHKLEPYTSWLDEVTQLNINTAPALVIASVLDIPIPQAQMLVESRKTTPFLTMGALQQVLGKNIDATNVSVSSRYFRIESTLDFEGLTVRKATLVKRNGQQLQIIYSQALPPPNRAVP